MNKNGAVKRFRIKVLLRSGHVDEHLTTVDAEDAHLLRAYVWTVVNSTRVVGGQRVSAKYVKRNVNGVNEYLHQRIVDARAGETVWHINGDSMDNRKANLMKDSQRVEEVE
jgi:hypothetical protein